MQSRISGSRHFIVLAKGEPIIKTLTKYLIAHDIRAGGISGIGAASHAKILFYTLNGKKYVGKDFEGEFEIVSLLGNASVKDGKPWPHIHITLTDTEYRAFGGHLEEAIVGVTCEIIIDADSAPIVREHDEETGLQLWCMQ